MSRNYDGFEYLEVDRPREAILRVTLNRPQKRNAMSNELRRELFSVLEQADVDDDVRVIILRGAGKCFSSGYDLSQGSVEGSGDRKSTRLNSSHSCETRMPSSACKK